MSKNIYNPRTVIDADPEADPEESHDGGCGDYNVTCWLADGTVLEMCTVFGDNHDYDWSTLKNMEGPTEEELDYPIWMRKKVKTTSMRIRRAIHLGGGSWLARKTAALEEIKHIGKILYITGAFRVHLDGDSISAVWRWWHPVSWLTAIAASIFCAFSEAKVQEVVPFKLSSYWQSRKDEVEWV